MLTASNELPESSSCTEWRLAERCNILATRWEDVNQLDTVECTVHQLVAACLADNILVTLVTTVHEFQVVRPLCLYFAPLGSKSDLRPDSKNYSCEEMDILETR